MNNVHLIGRVEVFDLEYNLVSINVIAQDGNGTIVNCIAPTKIMEQMSEYVSLNDVIAVKGFLKAIEGELTVQIEKVTFLTTSKSE